MEAKVYNQKGEETGKVKLPNEIFGLKWNGDLVHQVTTGMQANQRINIAHTKDRSEVSGGGKKPYRQKGTGRARHGSIRSPIWKGGGVTHGPLKDKKYREKINKKMKIKALYTILSEKLKDKEILFIDDIKLKEVKTKLAQKILLSLSKVSGFNKLKMKKKNNIFLSLNKKDEIIRKSFNNLPQIYLDRIGNINPLTILKYRYLIIVDPEKSINLILNKIK